MMVWYFIVFFLSFICSRIKKKRAYCVHACNFIIDGTEKKTQTHDAIE